MINYTLTKIYNDSSQSSKHEVNKIEVLINIYESIHKVKIKMKNNIF